MIERIIIAGSGGQGIMLLGKVIATAAMKENKFVTWLPAYGAEVRGGSSFCMVIISDEEIASPFVTLADTVVALNEISFNKFKGKLKDKGLLILNSSLAENKPKLLKNKLVFLPFSEIAITAINAPRLVTVYPARKNSTPLCPMYVIAGENPIVAIPSIR